MYKCCPSLLILPVVLRGDSLEPAVSVVGNLVIVVILLSVIAFPDLLMKWVVMIHE